MNQRHNNWNQTVSRGFKPVTVIVMLFLFISFLGTANLYAQATLSIDASTRHQIIRGWGAVMPWYSDLSDELAAQIIDVGVNDLGLNCFRYEGPAGHSNEWTRWEPANDDDDPFNINWDSYNLPHFDIKMNKWVVPIKNAVEAAGKDFDIQISPSFFDGGSSGTAPTWMLRSPGEYAEFASSLALRMRDVYGVTPDYYTICNEAGNGNDFSENLVGRMIKAVGPRFESLGLPTRIVFPESINSYVAWLYIQHNKDDERVWKYVDVLSYHLYGGNNYRDDLYAFALERGLETAQTEFMTSAGNPITFLYEDMTIGGVSEWEVYGQGFPVANINRTSFKRSDYFWFYRQVMKYVEPGSVRIDASSSDSAVRVLAFDNAGEITTLVINNTWNSAAKNVTLTGLPAGTYGVSQTINQAPPQELGVHTVGANGQLTLFAANKAVMTVYPHSQNLAPNVLLWEASDDYCKIGESDSTTLTVTANDPELDALSCQWRVLDAPAGASVNLVTPNNTSTLATGLTVAGLYKFAIEVSDAGHDVERVVLLNVYDGDQPPRFEIHNRQPVALTVPSNAVTLRAYIQDVDTPNYTYQWSVVSKPASANVTFNSPNNNSCVTYGLTVAGDYTFRMEITDPTTGNKFHEDFTVTVDPVNTHAPFINNLSATVLPTGSGQLSASTGDADGDMTTLWWEHVTGPEGGEITFSAQASETTEVTANIGGNYIFLLTVVDRTKYTTQQVNIELPGIGEQVKSRYMFYNNSAFDGNNPGVNASDSAAIPTDKEVLLPGQTATFNNYTSYGKGINGVIFDLSSATMPLTASDFQFKVGNDQNPAGWTAAPAPNNVVFQPGQGRFGSDRVTITFPDGSIVGKWLQVTVKSNLNTGLSEPDVFYIGNAAGDCGNSPTDTIVDATDEIACRNNLRHFLDPAPIYFNYDYSRDGKVDATDEIIARNNVTTFATQLIFLTAP